MRGTAKHGGVLPPYAREEADGEFIYGARNIAAEGVAILLTEQYARTALEVADYAAIMTQGRVRRMGEPADIGE